MVKAAIMLGDRKEVKNTEDVILVLQYRTQMIIKSFFTNYSEKIEKFNLVNVPFIFIPDTKYAHEKRNDKLYYMSKEGMSVKL